MRHLTSDQFVRLLGKLTLRDIEKYSEEDTGTDIFVVALTTRGHPADQIVEKNSEVYFIWAHDPARRREGGSNFIQVLRMNFS